MTRRMKFAAGFFTLYLGAGAVMALSDKAADGNVVKTPTSLQWQKVFTKNDASTSLEFTAHFRDAKGLEHQLHYWRDGSKRLRRNTDGNVDLMVERLTSGEYRYHVLDHRKKIITQIDRTNLHRIGQFSSWDDLARGLSTPAAGAVLTKSTNVDAVVAGYRCSWYELTQESTATIPVMHQRICWSRSLGVPLKITSVPVRGDDVTTWQVDKVSTRKLNNTAFTANVAGYAIIDANQDISPESD